MTGHPGLWLESPSKLKIFKSQYRFISRRQKWEYQEGVHHCFFPLSAVMKTRTGGPGGLHMRKTTGQDSHRSRQIGFWWQMVEVNIIGLQLHLQQGRFHPWHGRYIHQDWHSFRFIWATFALTGQDWVNAHVFLRYCHSKKQRGPPRDKRKTPLPRGHGWKLGLCL